MKTGNPPFNSETKIIEIERVMERERQRQREADRERQRQRQRERERERSIYERRTIKQKMKM